MIKRFTRWNTPPLDLTGWPDMVGATHGTLLARTISRVERTSPDSCWLWVGSRDKNGYGQLGGANGEHYRAHRVVYETFVGPLTPHMVVRHRCDNPPCCNPAHLESGTTKDNVRDRYRRQDPPRGERHARAKFSDQQVGRLRDLVNSGMVVAHACREVGISDSQARRIISGRSRMPNAFRAAGVEVRDA